MIEWLAFLLLGAVAVAGALGMLLTMSMYRAAIFLMASFVSLAGLFVLLGADLLAAIQVMMNVGGMLVMLLFMVPLMMDPGGEMMWDMKRKMGLPGFAALSMVMPRGPAPAAGSPASPPSQAGDWTCPMHPEVSAPGPGRCPQCGMDLVPRAELEGGVASPAGAARPGGHAAAQAPEYTCPMHPEVRSSRPGKCPKCGMDLVPVAEVASGGGYAEPAPPGSDGSHASSAPAGPGGHGGPARLSAAAHYRMMVDMAMSTELLPWAIGIGAASAVLLAGVLLRAEWPIAAAGPTEDAVVRVGELLLSRYMIAFEGAAGLILAGVVGAVILGKREVAP